MTPPRQSQPTPPPTLNAHLSALQPYPPGKPIEEVKREFGLDDVIKLASNENPLGPSPKALKAIAAVAGEMHLYPDGHAFYLRQALAGHLDVTPGEIILGNGSDEIALLLMLAYTGPRRGVITSDYAFVRYRMEAELAGAPVTLVPMRNMRHDLKSIVAAITPETSLICLDVPCNPTGGTLGRAEFERFMKAIPASVLVLLDQAYYEFAAALDENYPDGRALLRRFPNLIVTRTFSKVYGLAGLRIGYALARPEIVTDVDRLRPPFNTSRMGQAAAVAALGDAAHLRRSVELNRKGLAQMEKGLRALGLKVWPSLANFVLVDTGRDGREVFTGLLRRGVVTRPMGGYGLGRHLRISIGTAAENRRCLAALRDLLQEPATVPGMGR